MTPAVLLGLAGGTGLALVVWWTQARRPSLIARVSPHVRARSASEWRRPDTSVTPFPTLERLLAPAMRDAIRWVERLGSSAHDTSLRLARAGLTLSVEQYRAQQVVSVVAGLAAGALFSIVVAATRQPSPVALLVLTAVAGLGGLVIRDSLLSRQIAKREQRIVLELPTVAELLALSVSAGEGAIGALERVSRTAGGVMADELRGCLASVRAGTPIGDALQGLAGRTGVPALRRFADGVAIAVERGTPLADVLRAQAQDVREAGRRALMEEGGKKEIAMMVPVIFIILPITVIFAVFPGVATIRLGF